VTLRKLALRNAGVAADVVSDLAPAYYGLIGELEAYTDTILAAPPRERAHLVATGFDFAALERTKAVLSAQAQPLQPPDQEFIRAAARRLAGVVPPRRVPFAGDSPAMATIRHAIYSAQAILADPQVS
jgi:hypothetical protein